MAGPQRGYPPFRVESTKGTRYLPALSLFIRKIFIEGTQEVLGVCNDDRQRLH